MNRGRLTSPDLPRLCLHIQFTVPAVIAQKKRTNRRHVANCWNGGTGMRAARVSHLSRSMIRVCIVLAYESDTNRSIYSRTCKIPQKNQNSYTGDKNENRDPVPVNHRLLFSQMRVADDPTIETITKGRFSLQDCPNSDTLLLQAAST